MINMYPSLLKVSSKLIFRKEVQLFNLNTSHFITIELMSLVWPKARYDKMLCWAFSFNVVTFSHFEVNT